MIVISTIRYYDFEEDQKIIGKGKLLLKYFLKYAEESSFKASDSKYSSKETIISFIKKDLENKGYDVVTNVGNSEFRVDIAIKNKTKDKYELGILIDTNGIFGDISCRDKLYVQEYILNSLKWKIVNIYTLEYFKNKEATIDKIIEALEEPFIEEKNDLHVHIVKDEVSEFKYDTINYSVYKSHKKVKYDTDYGFGDNITSLIKEILEVEAPISFRLIKERIIKHSNIQVMKPKAEQRLINELCRRYVGRTKDQDGYFYWTEGSNKSMTYFRIKYPRDIYDIAKEEILAAMKQVLKVQISLSTEDLYRKTLEALETKVLILNKRNKDRLDYVLEWAKENRLINL